MRTLKTPRLNLRKLNENDAPAIYKWCKDPEVSKFLTFYPHKSVDETQTVLDHWLEEYNNPDTYRYGIELKDGKELIGIIDVVGYHHENPVIGYDLRRDMWNKGYMTEALKAVVDKLFKDGYETIVIEAAVENIGSNRVIEKNGFKKVLTYNKELKGKNIEINSYRLYKNADKN